MGEIRITVVMATHDSEGTVERALESVLGQTERRLEVIVVDDGSSDGTIGAVEGVAARDGRVTLLAQEHSGVSNARNMGLERARGDYYAFMDDDDEILPEMYERLLAIADERGADIVDSQLTIVYPNGTVSGSKGDGKGVRTYAEGVDALEGYLTGDALTTSANTKLFRRSTLGALRFVPGRRINEDKFLIFEALMECGRVCVSGASYYRYLKRDDSASRAGFSDRYLDALLFADEIEQRVASDAPQLADAARANKVRSYIRILQLSYIRHAGPEFEGDVQRMRSYLRGQGPAFCLKNLKKTDFARWLLLAWLPHLYGAVFSRIDNR